MSSLFYVIIILFVVGYACIALEHPLRINKAATALLLGVALWILMTVGGEGLIVNTGLADFLQHHGAGEDSFSSWFSEQLVVQLGDISQILFFLLGAMTIVELVDTFGGFRIITDRITTTSRVKFMWLLLILTFFLSSVLDNMTTTIVMVALLRKLVAEKKERWFFAGMIILAANAGGAWSPIGDVTTIMLWVSGKVTTLNIMHATFLASMMSIVVPMIIMSFKLKGNFVAPQQLEDKSVAAIDHIANKERVLILCMGVGALLFVPVFHSITDLPPYMGMLIGLGILWVTTELLQRFHPQRDNSRLTIPAVLTRIDVSSVLFFLGILLAVAALQVCGHLMLLSDSLNNIPLENGKHLLISYIIGLLSAVVDNVPLVAGAMGMYSFPTNHYFWEFVAYCAGTGGSILIIGSAAGVVAMGLEKIDFIWYLKKISLLALIGYTAGALTFVAQNYHKVRDDNKRVETTCVKTANRPSTQTVEATTFYLTVETAN